MSEDPPNDSRIVHGGDQTQAADTAGTRQHVDLAYTANAGDYLVNNRFVSGPAAVSLPSTLALLVAGAVALVVARRRR